MHTNYFKRSDLPFLRSVTYEGRTDGTGRGGRDERMGRNGTDGTTWTDRTDEREEMTQKPVFYIYDFWQNNKFR
jgi:hypothetical protein